MKRTNGSSGRACECTLITGGAGFIGANLAARLLAKGERVVLLDNLSRPGVHQNYEWLAQKFGDRVTLTLSDVRDGEKVAALVAKAGSVFHFAAQVAVTDSLVDPVADFETNARGTLNVLEALRRNPVPLVFTSTNKVYGGLREITVGQNHDRYEPSDRKIRENGVSEVQPLDFASPYGCSKGAADQYVVDYGRVYRLPSVVFRMSCIYGPHQFGTEDQGWVAHFALAARQGWPLTIYGDGRQVRDILYVDDLVSGLELARAHSHSLGGQAFNIGGGPENAVSLREVLAILGNLQAGSPELRHEGWRPGDQKYYVTDFRRFHDATGWAPQIRAARGLELLLRWIETRQDAPAPALCR